jgi:4a-hydroxytetrahydrobiopterin dehydratase
MRLSDLEVTQGMLGLNGWTLAQDKSCIQKEWVFDRFSTALAFFMSVGKLAEEANHHPECLSSYTRMRIRLWTHDANGLTSKDFELAQHIDGLGAGETQ